MYPRTRGGKGSPTKSDQPGVNIAVVNKFRCPPLRRSRRGHRAFGYEHSALLALLMALSFVSCKKDADTTAPNVEILAIDGAQPVVVPGNITVRVSMSDNHIVEGLTVQVIDAKGSAISNTASITIGSSSATVDFPLSITDERIRTGDYSVLARATDGTNDGRAFADLGVTGVPLRFKGLFAIASAGSSTTVYRVDSTLAVSTFLSLTQDAGTAAIDQYERLLFIGGTDTGPLLAIDLLTGTTRWQIANENIGGLPWFRAMTFDPAARWLWVAQEDGRIRAFSTGGGQRAAALAIEGSRPLAFAVLPDHVLSAQQDITLGSRSLVVYWRESGAQFNVHTTDHESVALGALGDGLVDFGNDASGATVHVEALDGSSPWEPITFPGQTFHDVCPIGSGEFLLALDEGVKRYSGSTSATSLSSLVADHLAYDAANEVAYAAVGDMVHVFNASTGAVIGSVQLPAVPIRLLAWLNKDP